MSMVELKSNAIKTGVTLALSKYLKANGLDGYEIVKERKEQGFKKPTFYVRIVNDRMAKQMDKSAIVTYMIEVTYFNEKNINQNPNINDDLDNVRDILRNALYVVEVASYVGEGTNIHSMPIRTTAFDTNVSDGVIVCTFNIKTWARLVVDENYLRELELNTNYENLGGL